MAKKLYIETHGCQMNEYDSSRMVDLLGEHQALEVTARAEDADVILLNTCSICSTVIPPGLRIRIFPSSFNPSTTVLSNPTPHAPPSMISGTLPSRSLATCSALVGLGFPDVLALGAASGAFATAIKALATGWDGMRMATED